MLSSYQATLLAQHSRTSSAQPAPPPPPPPQCTPVPTPDISVPPGALSFIHFPNLYKVFTVEPPATYTNTSTTTFSGDLQASYLRLMRLWHPDKSTTFGISHDESAIVYRAIRAGYQILNTPDGREKYDAEGSPAVLRDYEVDVARFLQGIARPWSLGREACVRDYGLVELASVERTQVMEQGRMFGGWSWSSWPSWPSWPHSARNMAKPVEPERDWSMFHRA